MVWSPRARGEAANPARATRSATLTSGAYPSRLVPPKYAPVTAAARAGVPPVSRTTAVNVTGLPTTDGLADDRSTTELARVPFATTVTVTGEDVLPAWPTSPL